MTSEDVLKIFPVIIGFWNFDIACNLSIVIRKFSATPGQENRLNLYHLKVDFDETLLPTTVLFIKGCMVTQAISRRQSRLQRESRTFHI